LRKMIPQHAHQKEWLDLIQETLLTLDEPWDLVDVFRTENLFAIKRFDDINSKGNWDGTFGMDNYTPPEFRFGPRLPRFREASLSAVHQYFATLVQHMPKDPYDFNGMQKAYDLVTPMTDGEKWDTGYLRMSVSTSPAMVDSARTVTAFLNALMQATAILRSDRDPGKGLPLMDRHRLDIDNNPIRILKKSKGWVVYSISTDGTDDSGDDDPKTTQRDFVVHLSMATVPPKPKPTPAPTSRGGPAVPGAPPTPSPGSIYTK